MSHSDEARRSDKRRTLIAMLREIGDHRVTHVHFTGTDPEVKDTFQTTWRELLDDGLIDDSNSVMGQARYRITAAGWLRALMWSGDVDGSAVRERCTRLAQALKRVVKGRKSHYDEFADVGTIAAESGLPDGWIVNAIKARLLGVVFPDDRWDAHMDGKSPTTIRISPTFGLNHLFDEE
jgi:hypothetical protein